MPANVLFVTVSVPPQLKIAPPLFWALLPLKVLRSMEITPPSFSIAPPREFVRSLPASFPEKVPRTTLSVPALRSPPPSRLVHDGAPAHRDESRSGE